MLYKLLFRKAAFASVRNTQGHLYCRTFADVCVQPATRPAESSRSTGILLQRYQALVETQRLKPDAQQQACVQQLSQLCDQLSAYSTEVEEFQEESLKYLAEAARLRAELKIQEAQALVQKKQQDVQRTGLWHDMMKRIQPQQIEESSPQEVALMTARAREGKVQEILGAPPEAPAAPKGLYLYGSVGSGKSLLMDMFYNVITEHSLVPNKRRMHFNAAMLELHTRLHKLEQERREQNAKKMEAYTQQVALEQLKDENKDKARLAQKLAELEDPFAQHQKLAKMARIAIRTLGRQRMKRSPAQNSELLAKSNAVILRAAAQSLIRGKDGDVSLGWDMPSRRSAAVLCFDEMQVTDPFAAVALKGVMEALLEEGCIIVATSNRAPWDLNRHGLHEDLFGHFVQNLLEACRPYQLSAEQDYRRLLASDTASAFSENYFFPKGPAAHAALDKRWQELTATQAETPAVPLQLTVMFGRRLQVEQCVGGSARFTFSELCNQVLGAADYIAVAQAFHTVFLTDVPTMSLKVRDQARRFITLVDELYNARVRLICSADSPPDLLFAGNLNEEPIIDLEQLQYEGAVEGSRLRRDLMAEGGVAPVAATANAAMAAAQNLGGMEEKFAFKRAVSRLHEMQSETYLASRIRTCTV